ncbi:MAG: hypothetical protein AB8B69_01940 [Chitinophagales bacterium]
MILKYQKRTAEVLEIEEKLTELSLAYKTELQEDAIQPILFESGQNVEGKEAIFLRIEEIAGELHKWYYGSC